MIIPIWDSLPTSVKKPIACMIKLSPKFTNYFSALYDKQGYMGLKENNNYVKIEYSNYF